jgi:uncharacterized membrane protein YhdT
MYYLLKESGSMTHVDVVCWRTSLTSGHNWLLNYAENRISNFFTVCHVILFLLVYNPSENLKLNLNLISDVNIGNYVITEAPSATGIGIGFGLVCFAFPLLLVVTIDVISVLKYVVCTVYDGSSHVETTSNKMPQNSPSLVKRLKRTHCRRTQSAWRS